MERPNRLYSAESQRRRAILLPSVLVLLGLAAFFQSQIDPTAKALRANSDKKITRAYSGLNSEFMLLPLLGFREAAAGLLWVRCDEFFHSGDYDAILPLVRLITWLDPHADNIFITGAWHLSYNFTDSSERSDRRYIAPSQALLDEGIKNNPTIPDINFEKGWQNYDKIKDYIVAEKALRAALATPPTKGTDDYPYGAPLKTIHLLAHVYEKQGRIPEAVAAWEAALARSQEMLDKKIGNAFSIKQLQAAERHNRDQNIQRWRDRYTTTGHSQVNPSSYPAVRRPAPGKTVPGPWDCSFQSKIEVTRPKVIKISGNFNVADGARVNVRITDWDYKERQINEELNSFDIDLTQTILVDAISVRKNRFEREMDMSKDPKMYGFNQPYYRITLYYDTRITSPHLQDRFGFSGEGITDRNKSHVTYDTNPLLAGTTLIEGEGGTGPIWDGQTVPRINEKVPDGQPNWLAEWLNPDGSKPAYGQPPRLIKVVYKVSKEQILGQKPITDKDIVLNE